MRRGFIAVIVLALALPASLLVADEILSRPARSVVGRAPADLHARAVRIHTVAGQSVAGWMIRGTPGAGAVLLLHGVQADRRDMIGRARFLSKLGYSVLLIDLPAHGESTGAHITFGMAEAQGIPATLTWLSHECPGEKIGVIGVSLGAASLVLSNSATPLSAVVLESMFPSIREAISDRVKTVLGSYGGSVTTVLLWQLPFRLHVSPEELRPIAEISSLHAPVLIAAGSADRYTKLSETRRIFATANEPKELWVVKGAAHVDLHAFDRKDYEEHVSSFLARYLGTPGPAIVQASGD